MIIQKDIAYRNTSKGLLTLDAYLPESDGVTPAVMLIHGGGFAFGDKAQPLYIKMAEAFAENGCAAFSINYTLTGEDMPGEDRRQTGVADAAAALAFLCEQHQAFGIDRKRIAVLGDSAGGAIAVALAYQGGTTEWISLLFDLWGGMPPYGDPIGGGVYAPAIRADAPPTLILHSIGDPVVPYATSVDLSNRLTALGIRNEIHLLESGQHFPEELADTFLPWMLSFLKEQFG